MADRDPLTARVSVLFGGLLALLTATLTAAAPLLGADAPAAVGLAVLVLAVAALVRVNAAGLLALRPVASYPRERQPAPALASRVADPVHHPVRPRAPGTV
jgi:hypothetical protein